MPDHYLFDVTDPLRRRVTLTPETWENHVSSHPEIADALAYTKTTVEQPVLIVVTPDGAHRYYRFGVSPRWPQLKHWFDSTTLKGVWPPSIT